jgi:hypothetical protein
VVVLPTGRPGNICAAAVRGKLSIDPKDCAPTFWSRFAVHK